MFRQSRSRVYVSTSRPTGCGRGGGRQATNVPRSGSPLCKAFRSASSPSSILNKSGTCFDARGSRSINSRASRRRPSRNAVNAMSADERGRSCAVVAVVCGPDRSAFGPAVAAVVAIEEEEEVVLKERNLSTMTRHTSSSLCRPGPRPSPRLAVGVVVAAATAGAEAAMSCCAQCRITGEGESPRKAERRRARRCCDRLTRRAIRCESGRERYLPIGGGTPAKDAISQSQSAENLMVR